MSQSSHLPYLYPPLTTYLCRILHVICFSLTLPCVTLPPQAHGLQDALLLDSRSSPPDRWCRVPLKRANSRVTSAGGGGKTKQRQEKIKEKNRKLDENRTKRIERERVAKEEARANGNGNSNGNQQQEHMQDAIHPSRRARVPGNAW
ncbi:hypothetical protein NM208_g15533 [Fusarium decemcellulare]|uniref:Uncharacterized protein n=1 Tax=Fusarium decemcellulare TaxID=57161 RepID=A0ACC1RFD9_9HYPO|nr:hypothetical protein NM208_g15533 [Fusarium decemcellulare]